MRNEGGLKRGNEGGRHVEGEKKKKNSTVKMLDRINGSLMTEDSWVNLRDVPDWRVMGGIFF